jgi:hypothetical protein
MAARLPALKVKEAQMQTEEARFLQMEASFSRRQQALRELREAVCAASVRLTPRAMARARSGDGEAELGSLRVAIECAEDTGALKADEVLAVRARALVVELEAEHERVAAAAAHAAAKAHRAAAASRLSAALDAADGSIGLRLRTLREAIHEARAAGFDDNELLVAEVTREALEATLQQQIAEAEANLVHTLRSTWGPRVSAEDARQRLLQLARTGKYGFDTAIRTRCDCGHPTRLTAGRHVCRYFGHFECATCQNRWTSAFCWKGEGQECRRCGTEGLPYQKDQLDGRPGGNGKPHDSRRCGMCKRLGRDCSFA